MAFAVVTLAFGASTLYANWESVEIETRTAAIAENTLPSIERLTGATNALRQIEAESNDYPDLPPEKQAEARASIERAWRGLDSNITAYLENPAAPTERALYEASVPGAVRAVDAGLNQMFARVEAHDLAGARVATDRDLRAATNRASAALRALISLNANEGYQQTTHIVATRRRAARAALILDALAVVVGAISAAWVFRLFRAHERLTRKHAELVEQRADELELFARRVAHDLLSPLSALTYCLGSFKRASETDVRLQDALGRARSCVTRAHSMVDGIFEFARAGAKPDLHERADLREIVDEIVEDLRSSDACAEIVVEPFPPCTIACSPGVLMSVLANLLRNAVKFMSDSELKRITVRVEAEGDAYARVEIEDTGPGIPEGMARQIFEPYVRGAGVTQPGLGLGLATVKRLCEGYGGEVGVRSFPGKGSTFWFSLPVAQNTETAESTPRVRRAG